MKPIKQIHYQFFTAIIFAVSLALLASCGGGGSGDDGGGDGGTTTTVSGAALAPNGTVALLRNQSFWYALNEFLFPSVDAAITGLEPVAGAKVELIEVDDAGVQVGGVLATTTTSTTGNYELSLPAGVNLKANLVVRISGTSVDLRAMVVETAVDITPLSEFILRKFVDSSTPLSTLAVNDVVKLTGYAKDFDVAATSDLSSMLAALENQLGSFVDDSIAAISATPGSGGTFAGEYHHNSFSLGFDYENDPLDSPASGELTTRTGGGLATLTDDGGNNIGVVVGAENNTSTGHGTSDNGNYWLGYEVNVNQGGEVLSKFGTVDSNGNLNLTFPFNEDFSAGDNHGYGTPPTTQYFYATDVAGLHFSTGVDPWATYRAIDTNGDGVTDAVDYTAYAGHHVNYSFDIVAPQASGMTQSDMVGDYGTVYIEHFFTNTGFSGTAAGAIDTTIDTSGAETDTVNNITAIARTPSSTTPGMVDFTDTVDVSSGRSGQLSVESNGQLTQTVNGSGEVVQGFASSNSEFAVLNSSSSTGTAPDFTFVANGQLLMVRKPTGAPDLSGRSYRLMGVEKQMDDDSHIRIQRLRGDNDKLTFSADGSHVSLSYSGRDVIARNADNADFTVTTTTDSGTVDHAVTIGSDGAISFAQVDTIDGFVRNWTGYISASTNIIILSSIERANDGTSYSLGSYIAIPVK